MRVKLKAYRLFYRSGTGAGIWASYREEVIFGEAELARRQGLQRPRLVHWEVAALHTCDVCRKRKPWTKAWRGVPAPGVEEAKARYARTEVTACSDECAERYHPGWVAMSASFRHVRDDDREPIPRDPRPRGWDKRLRRRWDAFDIDRDAKAKTREHRQCPMLHEGKGTGWCRWCGGEVKPPRQTWHEECLRDYLLHTEYSAQYRYLVRRDGDRCAGEGCEREGVEVDHVTPLWRVRDLPPEERRPYFGPTNLQLLCTEHHKEKTGREAGERARERVRRDDG